ncbi:MAG: 50S ribosomal protein L24 [Promethearchaeota archaeon]
MKVKSQQPRKQRKSLYSYKNNQRSKLLSTRIADYLQEEYGIKRLPIRVGDQVRVCKGEFKDFEGEVLEITKDLRCRIKEAQFEKTDGTQFHPAIHISNLIITKFTKEKKMDPWRVNMIERKAGYRKFEQELVAPKKKKEVEKNND